MTQYEYKILPAPTSGTRASGVKGAEARFHHALTELMNDLGRDGWLFHGTDSLPFTARNALGKRRTEMSEFLVFRREKAGQAAPVDAPQAQAQSPAPKLGAASRDVPAKTPDQSLAAE